MPKIAWIFQQCSWTGFRRLKNKCDWATKEIHEKLTLLSIVVEWNLTQKLPKTRHSTVNGKWGTWKYLPHLFGEFSNPKVPLCDEDKHSSGTVENARVRSSAKRKNDIYHRA
jgi:hypothetical protein